MATKKKVNYTPTELAKSIKAKDYSPIYLIYGDDLFTIEKLNELFETSILTEDEREFNQTVLYGSDVRAEDIIVHARRFPMMSEYQVVIVKEVQTMKDFKNMEPYAANPQSSTILVLSFSGKGPDKRQKAVQIIAKDYVMVETETIKEEKVPGWINSYITQKEYSIEPDAAILLAEFTGPDLARASMEADKLMLNEKKGHRFTSSDLEKHTGLNKEYNIYELQKALAHKDIFKSNSIGFYFAKNEKERPLPVVISLLYTFFSKVLTYHYLKSKGENNIGKSMGIWPKQMQEIEAAARNYSPAKLIHVIHHLRKADLQFKGYYSNNNKAPGILKELIFKIIH